MTEGRPSRPRLVRQGSQLALEGEGAWLEVVDPDSLGLDVVGHGPGLVLAVNASAAKEAWLATDIGLMSVPEVCTVIRGAGRTGVLEVMGRGGRRRLFFERGAYTGSMSTHRDDRLGEVVWRAGRITLEQLDHASNSMPPGVRIGRHLVDLGYLEQQELRGFLRKQAKAIFLEACLEPRGQAIFLEGVTHPNPVRFERETEKLVDVALALWAECARLERDLPSMDSVAVLKAPAPQSPATEAQAALLRVAQGSARPLSRADLLAQAALGRLHGLRALHALQHAGYFESQAAEPATPEPAARSRIERICEALNHLMEVLKRAGAGTGPVRDFLRNPPEHLADALAGINLDERLLAGQLELQAEFAAGGKEAMEAGLAILLDFALFEARDTLDESTVKDIEGVVAALAIF